MALLLLHMKYTRYTWHVTVSAYINDVVVSIHENTQYARFPCYG